MRPYASHESTLAWIKAVLDHTGLDPSNLARKAGLNTTTLTRFIYQADRNTRLMPRTLRRISEATGIALPAELGGRMASHSSAPARPHDDHELAFKLAKIIGCKALPESDQQDLYKEILALIQQARHR
jgi:hypothetical protein